jgi:hypothetical protein
VEVKIGIQNAPRELMLETSTTAEEVESRLTEAIGTSGVFILADQKGGKILVPASKIAYVELGGAEARRIGFGSI